jgi:2-dehydro-3-deoxyphosphooctonate aldolase (KDO 8-P synthase)
MVNIGNVRMGNNNPFVLIAGPCSMESEEIVMHTAENIKRITDKLNIPYIFKSSFDKANRTSMDSFRGPGLEKGLKLLNKVKEELGIPVTTDIHLPEQAETVGSVADLLQIPAFLCRQTDLIIAAAKTKKPVNVKKGQFLAPWDMKNVVNKMVESNNYNIMLTERGTSFGYNNLVVDMTGLIEMREIGYPIIFDATHSVQKPGGKGNFTGGNRRYAEYLSKAAIAVGIDGLFLEVHPNPDNALSDGLNMIKLSNLENFLKRIKLLDELIKSEKR